MTTEVLWRLMALWEGNERDGAAFAEAACACLDTLQPGAARTGRSARKEDMCWATPRNLLWIFVEELAIEGELTCDLLNLFEGVKKWFTWDDLPLFTGNGRVQRDGLTTQAFKSVRYGYANPEYNGGDVGHGEVDDHVTRTIRLAAASVKTGTAGGRRYVLVIPPFSRGNEEYRTAVSQMGGRILLECPHDSMGFIPDSHWKGGGKARTGNIQHAIAVVMFENLAAQKEKPYDENRLKRRLEAWLVSQRETRQPVGCPVELIPNDIRWLARTTRVDGDDTSAKWGHGGARRICAEWNPVLGGLGYPPPTFRAVMRNMGASPADARDANSAIASIMRAGAMELWNMHNQVQQQLEIERGISALDKRDKVKAAEHRTAN